MGLAAPRKRVKLSRDPNNTKWTRDTESFGHKTLTAQGWQPGDFLGATNSAHTEFHTVVNASHIRVVVKDDKLGLGAKRGNGLAEGECTGLDVYQSLLGRLNGKDEDELAKEQDARENLKRAIYNEQRWGSVRFVKGGFLIGDKIQELAEKEEVHMHQVSEELIENSMVARAEKEFEDIATKHQKKKRKDRGKDKKSTESLLEKSATDRTESCQVSPHGMSGEAVEGEPKKSKKRRKQPVGPIVEIHAPLPTIQDQKRMTKKKRKEPREHGERPVESQPSTSITADAFSTPQIRLGGRHAVRSRNIAQKRLAVLDTASLNQIFMIKK